MVSKLNDQKNFLKKIERLEKGEKPRVLDLFSGCGGISLGFHSAGFEICAAIEIDEHAAKTHAINFHRNSPLFNLHAQARDITRTNPEALVKELNLGDSVSECIDVIVGGPPCQAFARVGRAKLREIAEHPEAFLNDPRGNLYLSYLEYVEKFKPIVLLMENVPDILNYGGHNIAEEVCETLEHMGYTCSYTLLNAVFYGVPEMRERMFLVAYRKELNTQASFPSPTNWIDLPRGYHGSRQVALKTIQSKLLEETAHSYIDPPEPHPGLKPAVTAEEAIGDLPSITLHLEGKLKRGARRFTELTPYPTKKRLNEYSQLMRNWRNFENSGGIFDHLIRSLPRDYAIFQRMEHGNQYPEAYQHALELFEERLAEARKEGQILKEDTKEYEELKKSIVPPYDPGKFPNKWRKMEPNKPARTLMAHLGKDSYSHIHYDSEQARTISVREAARLQSFPDGFVFSGTMNPAFRQIGNAVPPLMAKAIGLQIMKVLTEKLKEAANAARQATAAVY
jgi:DNA (cytosine-5)-methyltransferase 1